MTAKDIQQVLSNNYQNGIRYLVPNVYFFDDNYHETDLLIVKDNGYLYDVEVKISVADYKCEFKKVRKHQILEHGYYVTDKVHYRTETDGLKTYEVGEKIYCERPNRFYFCCPENMLSKEAIPKYAGLLYVTETGGIKKIKEAPLLSKDIISVEPKLCRKFYYAYMELKHYKEEQGINLMKRSIAAQEKEIENLHKQIQKMTLDYWNGKIPN